MFKLSKIIVFLIFLIIIYSSSVSQSSIMEYLVYNLDLDIEKATYLYKDMLVEAWSICPEPLILKFEK